MTGVPQDFPMWQSAASLDAYSVKELEWPLNKKP